MNKRTEKVKLTVSIPTKVNNILRRQAFFAKLELSELFIEYQNAYIREKEREKAEKQQKESKKDN
jgi:hypothetical protein